MLDWQPMVDAAAGFASFFLWPWLVALWIFSAIIQRYPKIAGWFEALGWDGLREMLAGFGNSPSALMRARVDAIDQAPANVSELRRP